MDKTVLLRVELEQCQLEISNLENQIKKYERNYESLRNFKSVLSTSYEELEGINRDGINVLSELESIKKDCRTAKKYQEGMTSILNGIGAKVAEVTSSGLLVAVSLKLRRYMNDINDCDQRIADCRERIGVLERKIVEAETQMASGETGEVL